MKIGDLMPVERVVFLSSEYPPHVHGGLGTAVEALSRFLAAEGLEVVLFVPEAKDYRDPPTGVKVCQVSVQGATSDADYWLIYCQSARDAILRTGLRADVVHCHDWMTVLGGLAIGRAIAAPTVMSIHLPQVMPTNQAIENIGIVRSDAVLVNSQSVCDEVVGRHLAEREIFVIPNGVDLAHFSLDDKPPNMQQILFVGRLVPQKGVDVLIRAFGAILRWHPGVTLIIAGDGQQRLYLERLARFLGVRQSVSFIGWQSRDELVKLYQGSVVTAVPSLYEPFGLVALEAMASGRPVVVSRVGGLAETVEDGVSGFTVEVGDHLDLASRLVALLSDQQFARAQGLAARLRAERFDWSVIANRIARLYASLESGSQEPLSTSQIQEILSTIDVDLRERVTRLLFSDPIPATQHSQPNQM